MSLDEKIESLLQDIKAELRADISDFDTLLNHNREKMSGGLALFMNHKKSHDDIIKLKNEAEIKLKDMDNIVLFPVGYEYFEDVCYLDLKNIEGFEDLEDLTEYFKIKGFNFDKVFTTVNYLTYLYWYIKRLSKTQKNVKRKRAITQPTKEIISILKYIGCEHEASIPLVKLLTTFKGDHSNKIVSYENRIAYLVEKKTAHPITPPRLNIDELSELKKEYKKKIADLYDLIKLQNQRKYKKSTKELLKILHLPIQPVNI